MIDYYETKSQPITRKYVVEAWRLVKQSKGGAGIDNETLAEFEQDLEKNLYKIWNRMTSGSYFPIAVKQVLIPKKTGGKRPLGIPTVSDRVAQQVVKSYLEPKVEPYFLESSYGYRPKRKAHNAIQECYNNSRYFSWAIDLDLKSFFDTIDHELMLKAVEYFCKEKWVLMYIERWLKADVLKQEGKLEKRERGTPQGGVISPLLANIFLHFAFDKWFERNYPELRFERYADDIIIHCRSEREANNILDSLNKRLKECKLQLNHKKTRIVYCKNFVHQETHKGRESFDFLGYTFSPRWCLTKKGFCLLFTPKMSKKSKSHIFAEISKLKIHKWQCSIEDIAEQISNRIRGWINYYCKFGKWTTSYVWKVINDRLIKWLLWKRGYSKKRAIRWLKMKYKENPLLFPHWQLVHP